jgi:hypothetical protein
MKKASFVPEHASYLILLVGSRGVRMNLPWIGVAAEMDPRDSQQTTPAVYVSSNSPARHFLQDLAARSAFEGAHIVRIDV